MTYNTDKFDLGYMDHIYSKILPKYEKKAKKVLEIGVLNGESIRYWRDYFKVAEIYAIDINRCNAIENQERVNHIVSDAYSDNIVGLFKNESLDIIIDDGPHYIESFIYLIQNYIKKLKKGGTMVIENITSLYTTPVLIDLLETHEVKCSYTVYDMRFKQKTKLLYDNWKYGLDVLVIERP